MVTATPDLEDLENEAKQIWKKGLDQAERSAELSKLHAKLEPILGGKQTSEVLKKVAAGQGTNL